MKVCNKLKTTFKRIIYNKNNKIAILIWKIKKKKINENLIIS